MGRQFRPWHGAAPAKEAPAVEQAKIVAILDRTADLLFDLAFELRELSGRQSGAGRLKSAPSQEEIVRRLKAFWQETTLPPRLQVGRAEVDLTTAQGRWELLALALLRAARVREEVVAATFSALREAGLLNLERLAKGGDAVRREVERHFALHYKALGSKEAKIDALIANARRLKDVWGGDLNNLYEAASGDEELLAELRRFRHVNRIALWVCRTLRAHGVWPRVGPRASAYHDRAVRTPVERLRLAETDGSEPFELEVDSGQRRAEKTEAVVASWFAGDVLCLYLHGSTLCLQDDPNVCYAQCPVSSWCSFPQTGRAGDGERKV